MRFAYCALQALPGSGFARPFPANTHKGVAGAGPSRGDQAVALGVDIGGGVAGIDPQRMGARPADADFRQLGQQLFMPLSPCGVADVA
jgi:hypothetical protein